MCGKAMYERLIYWEGFPSQPILRLLIVHGYLVASAALIFVAKEA